MGQEGFQLDRSLREPASIVFRDRGLELAIKLLVWSIAGSGKGRQGRTKAQNCQPVRGAFRSPLVHDPAA